MLPSNLVLYVTKFYIEFCPLNVPGNGFIVEATTLQKTPLTQP